MNIGRFRSQCSHWFPTFLCRLRDNIKGRAIDLFARAHWFHAGYTLLVEIAEPAELALNVLGIQTIGCQ